MRHTRNAAENHLRIEHDLAVTDLQADQACALMHETHRTSVQSRRLRAWRLQNGRNLMGWLMGLEPTTTGITIQDSTN